MGFNKSNVYAVITVFLVCTKFTVTVCSVCVTLLLGMGQLTYPVYTRIHTNIHQIIVQQYIHSSTYTMLTHTV